MMIRVVFVCIGAILCVNVIPNTLRQSVVVKERFGSKGNVRKKPKSLPPEEVQQHQNEDTPRVKEKELRAPTEHKAVAPAPTKSDTSPPALPQAKTSLESGEANQWKIEQATPQIVAPPPKDDASPEHKDEGEAKNVESPDQKTNILRNAHATGTLPTNPNPSRQKTTKILQQNALKTVLNKHFDKKKHLTLSALEKITGEAKDLEEKKERERKMRNAVLKEDQRPLLVHPLARKGTKKKIHSNCNEDNDSVHIVWAFDATLVEPSFVLDHGMRKRLYCGNSDCLALEEPCMTVERLILPDLFEDTPGQDWVRQHALHKLLSGDLFEEQLQVLVQLTILYKHGGIVVQPGVSWPASTPHQEVWIGTTGGCGAEAIAESGGLVAMAAPKGSEFVGQLLVQFVQTYESLTAFPFDASWRAIFSSIDCDKFVQMDIAVPMEARQRHRYGVFAQGISSLHFMPLVNTFLESPQEDLDEPTLVVLNGEHPLEDISEKLKPIFLGLEWKTESPVDEFYMAMHWPVGVANQITAKQFEERDIKSFVTQDLSRVLPCTPITKVPELDQDDVMQPLLSAFVEQWTESCSIQEEDADVAIRRRLSLLDESKVEGWDLDKYHYSETEENTQHRLRLLAFCNPAFGDALLKFGEFSPEWSTVSDQWAPCPEPPTDESMVRAAMVVDRTLMKQEWVLASFANSLATNHKDPIILYILTTNLDETQRCLVRYMVSQPLAEGSRVHVISVDKDIERFANYKGLMHISLATQARLLLPTLLPCVPKVIWLDVDTIIMRSLTALWNIHPRTKCGIAGRPSFSSYVFWQIKGPKEYVKKIRDIYRPKRNGTTVTAVPGFNAGIVILDLDNLRHNPIYNKTVEEAAIEYGNDDQVTLNLVCNGSFTNFGSEWNMYHHTGTQKDIRDPALDKPMSQWGIIHWTSSRKPWKPNVQFKDSKLQLLWSMYKRKFSDAIACPPSQHCTLAEEENNELRGIVKQMTLFPTMAPSTAAPTPAPKKMVPAESRYNDKTCNYLPFGGEIVAVWAYDSIPGYFDGTFALYPTVWKRVVCRKEDCVNRVKALKVPCLRVQKWYVKDLVKDTFMEPWFEKNKKIALEGHLQVVMQLLYLYKFGGIVTKPGVRLPSPLPYEWIGAKEVIELEQHDEDGNKCAQKVVASTAFVPPSGVVGAGAKPNSPFIRSILVTFMEMFKSEKSVKIYWNEFFEAIDCSKWVQVRLT